MKGLLDVLGERLAENIQLLSSFDKYKREVLGGNLDWGPMHTSDQFWRENTAKLEEKDFQVIRVLLKLLETSRDVRPLISPVDYTASPKQLLTREVDETVFASVHQVVEPQLYEQAMF